jgi:hypothetical protein
MSEATPPLYRLALADSQHPANKAAWLIFQPDMDATKAAASLAHQQHDLLPLCYSILDDEKLYGEGGLGSGQAPVNAIKLLGKCGITEAAPRLLALLPDLDRDEDDFLIGALIVALKQMGAALWKACGLISKPTLMLHLY